MVTSSARVRNDGATHKVTLATDGRSHSIVIPPKADGSGGSSANGAELLYLALATCYCNDIYREAAKRNIKVKSVQVEVSGDFDGTPGNPVTNITYNAVVEADAEDEAIRALMVYTDTVTEIQNTLRKGTTVTLKEVETIQDR